MKLNKLFLLAPVALFSLSSCGKQVRYAEKDYVLNYYDAAGAVDVDQDESFNILQLSDIHFTYLADNQYHFKFIEKTINAAEKALEEYDEKLHLIVITGDTFTFATKDTIKECCDFFEKQGIPWTITFGNHDEQGYFSVDWMTNYLTELSKKVDSHLLFVDYPNDDIFGNANFVINLHNDEHPNDNRQIVIMDSNRYNYGEGMGYDYIHTDQIDWYERMYHYFSKGEGGDEPVSLAFFHIPLPEFTDAYNKAEEIELNENKGSNTLFYESSIYNPDKGGWASDTTTRNKRGEDESSPKVNTHFLDRIANTGFYTKGIFVGHDHINSYCTKYEYKEGGITFGYGIKSTNTVYYDGASLGGQIIRFGNDPDAKLDELIKTDLILHKYSDLEVK